MIVVTGALGFIGSCMIKVLNEANVEVVAVDDFYKDKKDPNLEYKQVREWIHRDIFLPWFEVQYGKIDAVFHLGARTDTTEQDNAIFDKLNVSYSKQIWSICAAHNIPLVYASSAATYGLGEHGYEDNHKIVDKLKPLNPYGVSKNEFDKWALVQKAKPPFWAGLKFFNVYGPNEYHKSRMASVIFHTYKQVRATNAMKLFRSHREDFKDGEQKRDFIYVKDVVKVCKWLMDHKPKDGLYNLGTGEARTFYDLAASTFRAMDKEVAISYIDTPEDIRDKYQYFTEADMSKLRKAGYKDKFYSLEEGVTDYVQNYLRGYKIW
jgi:ADP-L-glycero-D-manno-heptose 6-epimerase